MSTNHISLNGRYLLVCLALLPGARAGAADHALSPESPPAWRYSSDQPGEAFGFSASAAGDVNGDGYDDLVVGAPFFEHRLKTIGRVSVFYGSPEGFPANPGWTVHGTQHDGEFGYCVATAGDVNADGYCDVMIGAPSMSDDRKHQGEAYVFYGAKDGLKQVPDWIAAGATTNAELGKSIATAGDVNGDGFADVIVGAPFESAGGGARGAAYLYLGTAEGLSAEPAWSYRGNQDRCRLGWAVSAAGDVNGDGFGDVLVSAPHYSDDPARDYPNAKEGAVYLFCGGKTGLPTVPSQRIPGVFHGASIGTMVGPAGDVNGDGFGDIVLGFGCTHDEGFRSGRVALYLGSSAGLGRREVWTRETRQDSAAMDQVAAAAGDVNGDGFDDLLCGFTFLNNGHLDEGRVELYPGSKEGINKAPDWVIEGNRAHAWMGQSFGSAGDMNGDGRADVFVSAGYATNGFDHGQVFAWSDLATRLSPRKAEFPLAIPAARHPLDVHNRAQAFYDRQQYREQLNLTRDIVAKMTRFAEAHRFYQNPHQNAWGVARCEEKFGSLRRAEAFYRHAVRMVEKQYRYTPEQGRWWLNYQTMSLLANYWSVLYRQGRIAHAQLLYPQIELTRARARREMQASGAMRNSYYTGLYLNGEAHEAWRLYMDCRYAAFVKKLQWNLREARRLKQPAAETYTLIRLADYHSLFEEYDTAVECITDAFMIPKVLHAGHIHHSAGVWREWHLARRDGATARQLQNAEEQLAKLEEAQEREFYLFALTVRGFLLRELGRPGEAVEAMTALAAEAGTDGFEQVRARALHSRAESYVALGDGTRAEADCLQALLTMRALGQKLAEADIYAIYARALHLSRRDQEALRVWEIAFQMCETIRLPHLALQMLLGAHKLHMDMGNRPGAARAWARINAYLREQPSMPAPTMRKYRVAEADHEAFISRTDSVPPVDEIPAAGDVADEPPTSIKKEPEQHVEESPVLLKPETSITQVRPGELARARFLLFNAGSGQLHLDGATSAAWRATENAWYVMLGEGHAAGLLSPPLTNAPGPWLAVFMEATPSSGITNKVELSWHGGETVRSTWEYSASSTPRKTEVMTSSFEAANPFFNTAFYHEVYYRGAGEVIRNLKVEASAPCRIEILKADTRELMAIDANGDGDFEDAGDVMYQDADFDNRPDLLLSAERDVQAIELLIFAAGPHGDRPDEIIVDIYLAHGHEWEAQGSDILKLKP